MGSALKLQEEFTDLAAMAEEYCKIKQEIKSQSETLEVLREILLSAAQESGGKVLEGDFEISLLPKTRKNFDLKTAEKVLGQEILKPFYSQTSFEELRVKILPGE